MDKKPYYFDTINGERVKIDKKTGKITPVNEIVRNAARSGELLTMEQAMANEPELKKSSERFEIYKADDDKHLVFGWASIAITVDGEVLEDRQHDTIEPEELEEAAYDYVLDFRETGEEHMPGYRKKGRLVESCVFTEEKQKAMGIPKGILPVGWWIGFKIDDEDTWRRIKNGTYRMFSIEGKAQREPLKDEVKKFNPNHDPKDGKFTSAGGGTLGQFRTMVSGADDDKLIGMWDSYKEDTSNSGIAMNSVIETELENRGLIKLNDDTFEYELTDKAPKKPQKAPATPTNKDSTGKELTTQQAEYFKDSKARDEDGNLYVVYHNSNAAGIEEFRTQTPSGYGGLYTSTEESVSQGYGENTYKMYVNLKNPLVIDANGKRYDSIDPKQAPKEANPYNSKRLETNELAAYARDNGYDGVIVQNVMEGSGKLGTDIIAFHPDQLKTVDNKKPTSSRNIYKAKTFAEVLKFNPNHDEKGRFSSGSGGATAESTYAKLSSPEVTTLVTEMGQSLSKEDEAATAGYFGTGNAFKLNRKLRDGADPSEFAKADKRTCSALDRNMKPLTRDIALTRFIKDGFFEQFGLSPETATAEDLESMVGKVFKNKGYTSTSFDTDKNLFKSRAIRLNIHAPKGTKALVRPSQKEAEILLARNTSMVIKGVRKTGEKNFQGNPIFEVDVEVLVE